MRTIAMTLFPPRLLAAFSLALLLLVGCLEFDGQEITVVHDTKADRIDVHLVYRGYHATKPGTRGNHVQDAADKLATVRQRGVVCLFGSLFAFDPVILNGGAPELGAHIDVEAGPLFTDAQGLLCAEQFVRIRDARAFLEKLDARIKAAVQANLRPDTKASEKLPFDEESARNIEEWCRTGERFVLVEPGRIEFRIPLSDADHARMKEHLVAALSDDIADALGETGTSKKERSEAVRRSTIARVLAGNEFSIVREAKFTRFAVGVRGTDQLVLRKPPGGKYDRALLDHLVANGTKIEPLADEELERRFTAFRARDAVLAPELAAVRDAAPK